MRGRRITGPSRLHILEHLSLELDLYVCCWISELLWLLNCVHCVREHEHIAGIAFVELSKHSKVFVIRVDLKLAY